MATMACWICAKSWHHHVSMTSLQFVFAFCAFLDPLHLKKAVETSKNQRNMDREMDWNPCNQRFYIMSPQKKDLHLTKRPPHSTTMYHSIILWLAGLWSIGCWEILLFLLTIMSSPKFSFRQISVAMPMALRSFDRLDFHRGWSSTQQ